MSSTRLLLLLLCLRFSQQASDDSDYSDYSDDFEDAKPHTQTTAKPAYTNAKPAQTNAKPAQKNAKPAQTNAKPAQTKVKPAQKTATPRTAPAASAGTKRPPAIQPYSKTGNKVNYYAMSGQAIDPDLLSPTFLSKFIIDASEKVLAYKEPKQTMNVLRMFDVSYLLYIAPAVIFKDRVTIDIRIKHNRLSAKLGSNQKSIMNKLETFTEWVRTWFPNSNHISYLRCMSILEDTYSEHDKDKFSDLLKKLDQYDVTLAHDIEVAAKDLFVDHINKDTIGQFAYDALLDCTKGLDLGPKYYLMSHYVHSAFDTIKRLDDGEVQDVLQLHDLEWRRMGLGRNTRNIFTSYEFRQKFNNFFTRLGSDPQEVKMKIGKIIEEFKVIDEHKENHVRNNEDKELYNFASFMDDFYDIPTYGAPFYDMVKWLYNYKSNLLEFQTHFQMFTNRNIHDVMNRVMESDQLARLAKVLNKDGEPKHCIFSNDPEQKAPSSTLRKRSKSRGG